MLIMFKNCRRNQLINRHGTHTASIQKNVVELFTVFCWFPLHVPMPIIFLWMMTKMNTIRLCAYERHSFELEGNDLK